jgi:hypothetical protein
MFRIARAELREWELPGRRKQLVQRLRLQWDGLRHFLRSRRRYRLLRYLLLQRFLHELHLPD